MPLGPAGGLAHGLGGDAAQRRDAGGQVGAAGQHRADTGQGGIGPVSIGPVSIGLERHAGRRAAVLVAAHVGPVAAVLRPEELQHVDLGLPGCVAQFGCQRGHQGLGTVSDGHCGCQLLLAQHGYGVRDDVGDQARLGRIGQVIAERDPDAVVRRRNPDHDQTGLGYETEQMRDEPEHARGRVGPDDRDLVRAGLLTERVRWQAVTGRKDLCHEPRLRRGDRPGQARLPCLWISCSVIHRVAGRFDTPWGAVRGLAER